MANQANILLIDIENAPNLAYVWELWKQDHISTDFLKQARYILSYAAKWYGKNQIFYDSLNDSSQKEMLKGVFALLDNADLVVHYNGKRHDIPYINSELVELGFGPPSPYKQVDLYTTVKNKFKFPSNKLSYVSERLGLGGKVETGGYKLWIRAINGEQKAWDKLQAYNIRDVELLEKVYNKLRPWVKDHPNVALYDEDTIGCPACGGKQHWLSKKPIVTKNLKYPLYQCRSCKTWYRGTKALGPKAGEKYATI